MAASWFWGIYCLENEKKSSAAGDLLTCFFQSQIFDIPFSRVVKNGHDF